MSFGDGSGLPEDFGGNRYAGKRDNTSSPEVIDVGSEDSESESHPEAAAALRALNTYREQIPGAAEAMSMSEDDDEDDDDEEEDEDHLEEEDGDEIVDGEEEDDIDDDADEDADDAIDDDAEIDEGYDVDSGIGYGGQTHSGDAGFKPYNGPDTEQSPVSSSGTHYPDARSSTAHSESTPGANSGSLPEGGFHSSGARSMSHSGQSSSRESADTADRLPDASAAAQRRLEAEVAEIERAQWELQRQLHQARLQVESARAEQHRQAVVAAAEINELRDQRAAAVRDRAELESRVVALHAESEARRVDLEAKERAYQAVRERFNTQAGALAEVRAQVAQLQRDRAQFESQAAAAQRAEERAQRQLEQLRGEFTATLDEVADARAKLKLYDETIAAHRSQAREDAIAELTAGVEFNADGVAGEEIWRQQYLILRSQVREFEAAIEAHEPEIEALKREADAAVDAASAAADEIVAERSAADEARRKLRSSERRAADLAVQQQLTESLLSDLRRQVLVLLTDKVLSESGDAPLTRDDEEELARLRAEVAREDAMAAAEHDDTSNGTASKSNGTFTPSSASLNGQKLITERLLLFRDVAELQFQNEALLKACRELASQLDPAGDATTAALAAARRSNADETRAASDALAALQAKHKQLAAELAEARAEATQSRESAESNAQTANIVRRELQEAHTKLRGLRERLTETRTLTDSHEGSDMSNAGAPSNQESLLRLQIEGAEARLKDVQAETAQLRDENRNLADKYATAQLTLGRAEERSVAAERRAAEAEAKSATAASQLASFAREKELWSQREQQLLAQIASTQADLESSQRQAGRDAAGQEKVQQRLVDQLNKLEAMLAANSKGAQLQAECNEISEKLTAAEAELEDIKTQLNTAISQQKLATASLQDAQGAASAKDAEIQDLKREVERLRAELELQMKAASEAADTASKRDEELVEQVNNLEDQLTEVEAKVRQEVQAGALEQAKKEVEASLRSNLEPDIRAELEQSIRPAVEAELRSKLQPEIRAELESETRTELPKSENASVELRDELRPTVMLELRNELKPEIEAQLRPKLVLDVEREVRTSLRSDLESEVRSELRRELLPEVKGDLRVDARDEVTEEVRDEITKQIRDEVTAKLREEAEAGKHKSTDDAGNNKAGASPSIDLGGNVAELRIALEAHAPADEVEAFQRAVLSAEQQRVKDAFIKKLAETRTEAQKQGEESAAKRFEIRTKLQSQKTQKLEAEVEELRTKVRRLKGGLHVDDSAPATPKLEELEPTKEVKPGITSNRPDSGAKQDAGAATSWFSGATSRFGQPTAEPFKPFQPSQGQSFFGQPAFGQQSGFAQQSTFGQQAANSGPGQQPATGDKRPGSSPVFDAKKRKESDGEESQ